MHYIVLQTVQTLVTINRVTSHEHCLSYHESKFFIDQLIVYVDNKLAVLIMNNNKLKYLKDMLTNNTKLV